MNPETLMTDDTLATPKDENNSPLLPLEGSGRVRGCVFTLKRIRIRVQSWRRSDAAILRPPNPEARRRAVAVAKAVVPCCPLALTDHCLLIQEAI